MDAFDPTAYKDDVKARIEAAIERKIEGKEIEVAPTLTEPSGQVIDLRGVAVPQLGAGGSVTGHDEQGRPLYRTSPGDTPAGIASPVHRDP